MSDEGTSTNESEVGRKQLTRRGLLATGAGGVAAMYGLGAARASGAVPCVVITAGPGATNAVTNANVATPKLIDICCIVLAMELALLVCSSVTSA